ncbi:hypothetical protein ILYODFUR_030149 [Ilyodon furcidens]|uniref:FAM171 N-terminal domain-containing protein n=1 Tax=Ilyodon furcidens TaxID=33524 RepID=A0ABV0TQX2_9TELE
MSPVFFTLFPSFLFSFAFFPVRLSDSPLSCFFFSFLLQPRCLVLFPLPLLHCYLPPAHFPFLLHFLSYALTCALVGTEKKFELTPVAAISVHLLASDGAELQVNGPITFSVPLPVDSSLKENDHIPAWRFDPRLEKGLRDAIAGKGLDCQSIRLHSPQHPLRTFRERISFGLCLWCRNALRYRIALC